MTKRGTRGLYKTLIKPLIKLFDFSSFFDISYIKEDFGLWPSGPVKDVRQGR